MPLFDTDLTISDVQGLQAALDDKVSGSPGAWQDLPLASGWSLYGTGYTTPQCRRLTNGLIEVKGVIKKSTALMRLFVGTTIMKKALLDRCTGKITTGCH